MASAGRIRVEKRRNLEAKPQQGPGPIVPELVYTVQRANPEDYVDLIREGSEGAVFAIIETPWFGSTTHTKGKAVVFSTQPQLLEKITSHLSPTVPVGLEQDEIEYKRVPFCEVCSQRHALEQFPLVWGAYRENGVVVCDDDVKAAWWHKTNSQFPFKHNMTFCTAKNIPVLKDLKPSPNKPDAAFRIDMWLSNFADSLERAGDSYLQNPDFEPFRGFLAGVGSSQRVDEIRKMVESYRKEHVFKQPKSRLRSEVTMKEDRVVFHFKCLAGRLLTMMDAMFGGNEKQNAAMVTLIKKDFREQLSRVSKELWKDPNEDSCDSEQTKEQRAAAELSLVD